METRTYEREKLYKEIWAEPMTKVAKRYGISDVALRKNCKKLNIPTPPNGYWAKVQAGQKTKIPPLPKSKGPDKIIVEEKPNISSKIKRSEILLFLSEEQKQTVMEFVSIVTVPDILTNPHELIKDTIQYFKSRKESTKPSTSRVMNFCISNEQKDRAYRILNTLFVSLEHLGYSVEIKAPNAQHYRNYEPRLCDNITYINLERDSVPIKFREKQLKIQHEPTKEEIAKQRKGPFYIPPYDYVSTGIFTFEIDEYHCRRKRWHDTDNRKIENQIGEIIIWLMEAVQVVKTKREEHELEAKRRLEEELERKKLEKIRKHETELVELLEKLSSDSDKAEKIRGFTKRIELKCQEITDLEKRKQVQSFIRWARDKADWIDPLIAKEDEILGGGEYLFDLIEWED
ncbi:hypothetical protein DEAC_c23100 [Desulfosporosinus acididurans]|uniref:Uncharacterized protein n=1 Tax=Desulfosporosinus acididurans TaxID=476652 RepID=A0A0J1FQA7_9FIRM|nr:hypothetical protein [Desulfosporosinus acididurans]KLU65680.1 hypothetical protein DEAC_c23100 [Desulfosporosinus acididurans]